MLSKLTVSTFVFPFGIAGWHYVLPPTVYARYGSYVNFLKYIDESHPGAKDEIKEKGISVQHNDLGIGQAIDLAGEQTYM